MHVAPHHSPHEILRLMKAEGNVRRRSQLQAVHLALQGHRVGFIARTVGVSPRTVSYWLERYNKEGQAGLDPKPGRGRRPLLSPSQRTEFEERLKAGVLAEDEICSFRGLDFQRILRDDFGVQLSLSSVFNLFHELGYSSLMPRPLHPKGDPIEQAAFKKTARLESKLSKPN